MATRFGGASPTYAYSIRMRYIVGCLLLIILVLIGTLLFFVQRQTEPTPTPVQPDQFASGGQPAPTKADIVVALQRIEEGAALDKSMFGPMAWSPEQLPENHILWKEIDAFIPNRFASRMLMANMPVTRDAVTDKKPETTLNIPPGFRATTITVDSRSGVEGWAKPNTRVDILLTFVDRTSRRKKVATIARFVKILSVSGQAGNSTEARAQVQGRATVTLLVEERVAKKIELARQIGELSLALVGNTEAKAPDEKTDVVTEKDLFNDGEEAGPAREEPTEGVITTTDPRTGRPVRMFLRNGRWVPETADKTPAAQ